jgi:REP element-mobilizing transposase RayT
MLRGINQQDIFEDKEDFIRFLTVIRECKDISGFELYAYCLMTNHVHFLIKTVEEPLEMIFKRIGSRYVYWYNLKYQRSGHLFQDRYKSEIVENESYFLTALRYIIQNPMKAGIEDAPGIYPWSSYRAYLGRKDRLTVTGFAEGMFRSGEELIKYLNQKDESSLMDITENPERITDERAGEIMRELTGCRSLSEFQLLEKKLQKEHVVRLRGAKLSLGQISRLTGMPKATIHRCIE